jgi:hypothetical protein
MSISLSNADQARIPPSKLTDYLLNESHPRGSPKARLLMSVTGFSRDDSQALESAIRMHLERAAVEHGKPSPYGIKYEVVGPLVGPGGHIQVRSIWMIDHGETVPNFVTLFPEPKQ